MIFRPKNGVQNTTVSARNLLVSIILALCCITVAILCATLDPLLLFVRSKIKIVEGGLIHEVLQTELKGLYIEIYAFNITNGDRFLSGEDHKLKMEEVGPFVYQEYRTNEDIEILPEEGIMRYSPKIRTEFILEDSIGDPKNITLTVPNIVLLSITALLNSYPLFIKNLYQLLAIQQNAKAFVQMDVHSYVWESRDPLISAVNKIVPGLIYYHNIGIVERLYDSMMDYRLEIGATEEDKFQVKWANRTMKNKMAAAQATNMTYNSSYEGMVYPPDLPPDAPRYFFKQGICKALEIQFVGKTMLHLNTEGYVFDYHRRTFENKKMCDTKGHCPYGLLDMSECFTGIPFALSRSHFTGGDPSFFDRIEGLKPDPIVHETSFRVEPRLGLLIDGKTSLQINVVMGDLRYNSRLRRFSDMVVPLLHARGITPPLPETIRTKLDLFYLVSYKVMMAIEVVLALIGLLLLGRAIKIIWVTWSLRDQSMVFELEPNPDKDSEKRLIKTSS